MPEYCPNGLAAVAFAYLEPMRRRRSGNQSPLGRVRDAELQGGIMKILKILLACAVLALSQSAPAHADKAFDDDLKKMANSFNGCSKVRRKFRQYRKEYPEWEWAFAGRSDAAGKRLRGCGFWYSKSAATSRANAMKYCKEWEVKYGTNGGKMKCRILE